MYSFTVKSNVFQILTYILDSRGQMNSTAMPWRIFFYRIPLARMMKNRILQGWMISQYCTLKSKLLKYCLKKSSMPQYHKPPFPPLSSLNFKYSHLLRFWAVDHVPVSIEPIFMSFVTISSSLMLLFQGHVAC